MQHKSVYFAQRNPALAERFRPRWRRHAALAMSMPTLWNGVARYAQYDPLDDPPEALGVTSRYDGIGMTWWLSPEALEAALQTDAIADMRQDEIAVFGRSTREFGFRGIETVLRDDRQALFKIFSIFEREESTPTQDFTDVLCNGLAADLLAHAELERLFARMAVTLPVGQIGASLARGRSLAGVLELSFDTLTAAATFFSSDALAQVMAVHRPIAIEAERCVTREVLLDDRMLYD